jgi:sugar phosphate isomerase/epimerase
MPLIALSTCWNSPRHTDGYEMLAEIAALGFKQVELSHGIRLSLVPGILRAVQEKLVRVSSTHNFCPLPPGVNHSAPNMFTPSSADERILTQWQRYTRRSLDFAKQVGASIVVSHLGDVEFGWRNPARKLSRLEHAAAGQGEAGLEKLRAAAAVCIERGQRRKPERWDRVCAMLEEVLPDFVQQGMLLGAENREKCEELPFDDDFSDLLARFQASSGLAAWHDTGHAHLKEKMGVIAQEQLLETTVARLAGFHVHDVSGFADHNPPGRGEIDFEMIARFVRPHHLLTLELHPRLNPAEVVDGRKFLEDVFRVPA